VSLNPLVRFRNPYYNKGKFQWDVMPWKLFDTEDNLLIDEVHWHERDDIVKAEKLSDFIVNSDNAHQYLEVDDFMFLFFDDWEDYRTRFRDDMETSVLGSRPILYLYLSDNTNREGKKIGQGALGHERMQKHTRASDVDFIGNNPGVVILKCTGTRSTDEFNVRAVRELCEILLNEFFFHSTGKYDNTDGHPREYVSRTGCKQARKLIEAMQKAVHDPLFGKIVGSAKTVNLEKKVFTKHGV